MGSCANTHLSCSFEIGFKIKSNYSQHFEVFFFFHDVNGYPLFYVYKIAQACFLIGRKMHARVGSY